MCRALETEFGTGCIVHLTSGLNEAQHEASHYRLAFEYALGMLDGAFRGTLASMITAILYLA